MGRPTTATKARAKTDHSPADTEKATVPPPIKVRGIVALLLEKRWACACAPVATMSERRGRYHGLRSLLRMYLAVRHGRAFQRPCLLL